MSFSPAPHPSSSSAPAVKPPVSSTSASHPNPVPPTLPADVNGARHADGASNDGDHHRLPMDTINSVREGKEKARAVMAASLGQEHDPAAPFSRDKTPSTTTAPTVNGESQSRKRSRSGSRIPTQPPLEYTDLDLDAYLVHQAVTRDQHYAVSVIEQALAKADLNKEKVAEKNYYVELKRRAAADPGSIYGYGFEGFGNGRTDTKPPRILYPAERARRRRARDLRVSREKMSLQADQLEELVPVRLD